MSVSVSLAFAALVSAPLIPALALAEGSGKEGGGGTGVEVGGHIELRDLVDTATCHWVKSEPVLKQLSHLPKALAALRTVHWFMAAIIPHDLSSLEKICFVGAPLRPVKNQDDLNSVLPYLHRGEQVAIREGRTVYINQAQFQRMDAVNQAYLFIHESLQAYFPKTLTDRQSKLEGMVKTIRAHELKPMPAEDFAYQMSNNEIALSPWIDRLEPYRREFELILDPGAGEDDQIRTAQLLDPLAERFSYQMTPTRQLVYDLANAPTRRLAYSETVADAKHWLSLGADISSVATLISEQMRFFGKAGSRHLRRKSTLFQGHDEPMAYLFSLPALRLDQYFFQNEDNLEEARVIESRDLRVYEERLNSIQNPLTLSILSFWPRSTEALLARQDVKATIWDAALAMRASVLEYETSWAIEVLAKLLARPDVRASLTATEKNGGVSDNRYSPSLLALDISVVAGDPRPLLLVADALPLPTRTAWAQRLLAQWKNLRESPRWFREMYSDVPPPPNRHEYGEDPERATLRILKRLAGGAPRTHRRPATKRVRFSGT